VLQPYFFIFVVVVLLSFFHLFAIVADIMSYVLTL